MFQLCLYRVPVVNRQLLVQLAIHKRLLFANNVIEIYQSDLGKAGMNNI
jgi:hypothetical protein